MRANNRYRRKSIRYSRWAIKAAFLLLFMVPVAYISGAPQVSVYSLLPGEQSLAKTSLIVPLAQSVCNIWTSTFGNTNPGAWILCPLGEAQTLLTGEVEILAIVAMLLFIIPMILLGNAFCSWACPIGTIIDSFDEGIEKFSPKIEANRNKRRLRQMQSKQSGHQDNGKNLLCPSCPVVKVPSKRFGNLANGVMASVFVGAAALRLPVFCVVCPMGIATRGWGHLKTMASITGKYLPLILEFWSIPIVAVLLSLKERRFWCKQLCPLGALLRGAGALNPLITPRVEEKKCIMKGCPEDCEEGHLDLCLICRSIDDKKCEKVCPMDINLADHGSLNRCTKCLECYVACDYNAVKIDLLSKPEVFRIGFFRRLRARKRKDQVTQIENRSNAAEN